VVVPLLFDPPGQPDASRIEFRPGEDDGTQLVPVARVVERGRRGERLPGVVSVHDARREMQAVFYSSDLSAALSLLVERVGEEDASWCRVLVFANASMRTAAAMEAEALDWIKEAGGTTPPGNGADADLWRGERHQSAAPSRQAKKTTKGAAAGGGAGAGAAGDDDAGGGWGMVSPFASVAVQRNLDDASGCGCVSALSGKDAPPALTRDNADACLDEVRPFLLADGGNVTVLEIREGSAGPDGPGRVAIVLEGNCSTCDASNATVKMGIEKALRGLFGPSFEGVDVVAAEGDEVATAEGVDMLLNMLRGAIDSLGGSVEVVAVEDRGEGLVAELDYAGPEPIAKGVAAAVRERFPDLVEVKVNVRPAPPKAG